MRVIYILFSLIIFFLLRIYIYNRDQIDQCKSIGTKIKFDIKKIQAPKTYFTLNLNYNIHMHK